MLEAGEMVDIKNKAEAKKIIRGGFAIGLAASQGITTQGCGVAIRGKGGAVEWIEGLSMEHEEVATVQTLPYPLTILWDSRYSPNTLHLIATLRIMREFSWEIAVPIKSYAKLVKNVGTEEERKQIKEQIHDLRVPYYNTHLMFVRRNACTLKLMETWYRGQLAGGDDCLAFMKALYQVKPLILPLPVGAIRKVRRE